MRKGVIFALVGALILSNGFWLYNTADQAVTLDGCTTEVVRYKRNADVLAALVMAYPWGVDVEEAQATIVRRHPGWIVKRAGDRLQVEGVTLQFRDGRLVQATPALE